VSVRWRTHFLKVEGGFGRGKVIEKFIYLVTGFRKWKRGPPEEIGEKRQTQSTRKDSVLKKVDAKRKKIEGRLPAQRYTSGVKIVAFPSGELSMRGNMKWMPGKTAPNFG